MKKVYIASPYTIGDQEGNVQVQIDIASKLIDKGFAPFWPLHSHYLHVKHPKQYDKWMELDFEWLLTCDVLLRLPGESSGADQEVKLAKASNIPVVYKVEDLALFENRNT